MNILRVKLFMCIAVVCTILFAGPSVSSACTGLRVIAKDGSVVWVRSMEFGAYIGSDILVMPRGMAWTSSAPDGHKGIQWTSKYAFVGPNGFNLELPLEAMNEKGLYVGGFWMLKGETEFPTVTAADYPRTISQVDLSAWLLSNFSTVAEVKAALSKVKLAGVEVESMHAVILAHWYVMDATGKAAVIESIDGKVTVTDNPVGVFTNSPSFGWHMTHLRQFMNLRPRNVESAKLGDYTLVPLGEGTGLLGLPGDLTPPSRFVRAAVYANSVFTPDDADGAVTLGMNLIASFAIPKGVCQGVDAAGNADSDYTQWTTVYDFARKALYFRTYDNQDYRVVHFDKLPLDSKKPLAIHMGQAMGVYADVSGQAK